MVQNRMAEQTCEKTAEAEWKKGCMCSPFVLQESIIPIFEVIARIAVLIIVMLVVRVIIIRIAAVLAVRAIVI